jgi:hypothetical protein
MNVREAVKTISGIIDTLYLQGAISDEEMHTLAKAEIVICDFLDEVMEV